jgi:hypothetical protein
VTLAVVEALAAHEGVPPTALDHALDEAVDADALDRLLGRDDDGSIRVTFVYGGDTVTVRNDGTVRVR